MGRALCPQPPRATFAAAPNAGRQSAVQQHVQYAHVQHAHVQYTIDERRNAQAPGRRKRHAIYFSPISAACPTVHPARERARTCSIDFLRALRLLSHAIRTFAVRSATKMVRALVCTSSAPGRHLRHDVTTTISNAPYGEAHPWAGGIAWSAQSSQRSQHILNRLRDLLSAPNGLRRTLQHAE